MGERHDDTRKRLLEAAGEVFAQKGFRAATVREICHRAGANVAAVNYHFGDKQRLYLAAVGYAHEGQKEHRPPQWAPNTPPADKLRGFIAHMLASLQQEDSASWGRRLLMRELAEPTEACAAVVNEFVRPRAELLDLILSELLPPGTPPSDRGLVASSIVGQCLFHWVHWPIMKLLAGESLYELLDVGRLADHVARFSLAALGHAPPLGRGPAALGGPHWQDQGEENRRRVAGTAKMGI